MAGSVFQSLTPAEEPAVQAELVQTLSEAMSDEGLANYFTRRNREAAARLWAELLRLALAAGSASATPQLFCLADRSAVAVMQRWPDDRNDWHRGVALRRLAKVVPFGKWRALREALLALDKQKAAFYAAHGPFYYLTALATAPAFRRAGLGAVLLDHLCRLAEQQQLPVYVEATSDASRRWLRGMGFGEVMRHSVREHAPEICIMVRRPGAAQAQAAAAASQKPQARANGSTVRRSGSSAGEGGGQQGGAPPRPSPRPVGSVRSL